MYEDGKAYVLNPDFQRRHRWNRQKQSRLIESFIMNGTSSCADHYLDEYFIREMDGCRMSISSS